MATIKITYGSIVRRFTISSDITWSNLVSQLHDLFQIPDTAPINVSYTDEDGDVVSVSSDLELREIFSLHSAGKIVRLVIKTDASPNNVLNEIGKTTKVLEQLSIEEDKIIDESSHVKRSSEKEVKQNHTNGEPSSNMAEDEPAIVVIRITRPWCRSSFCGRRHFRYGSPNSYQPYTVDRPLCSFESSSHCNGQSSSREQVFSDYGRSPRCHGYHRQKQDISSEQLAENIRTLNSMGFPPDDRKHEKLLKRYNGHVDRVVDILLKEQGDKSNEKQLEVQPESLTPAMMEVDAEKNEERPYALHE